MDITTFSCITPEVRRLASFQCTPLPNNRKLSISNSPAKLAKAGFTRKTDAVKDEVWCDTCGIVYGDWAGESPFAVHRVLCETCPILTNTGADDVLVQHPRVLSARRQLFPVDEPEADDRSEGESEGDAVNHGSIAHEHSDRVQDESDDSNNEEMTENDESIDNRETDNNASVPLSTENSASVPLSVPTYVSLMSAQARFSFPFKPLVGGFTMLFSSHRQKTFSDTGCPDCIEWAEEGFVFRSATRDVQCVFCALILPFHTSEPQQAHAEKSVYCPRVLLIDVGNISAAEEERIKLKNLQRQLRMRPSPDRHYAISHPQYEEESVRLGTYDNWPHSSWDDHLQPSVMSQAGFYFTGCADKVKCYCCGVGLYRWRQGADPWEQHAHHMPACPHLLARGHHFLQQAAQAQVLTEADLPSASADSSPGSGSDSPGQLWTSPPGSVTLDVCAVTAALSTSQYTPQQVRHAVLTYFCHTSRFPTKDILLGTLKAADENYTTVCQQRDALHHKDTALQQTYTALQQKDTVIQQTYTALQQKDTVIQQKDTALQQTHTELQQHVGMVEQQNQELQQKNEIIHQHQLELSVRNEELQAREEELERKRRQMSYQESQIDSLRIQMQALLAERRQAGQQAAALQAPAAAAVGGVGREGAGEGPVMCDIRCKVCLSAESNTIFQPCQHITCCSRCAHQLFNNVCPLCRAPIRAVLPAYIA